MKGTLFYVSLMLAVQAERFRALGRRVLWSARGLFAKIFLPDPCPSWGGSDGGRAKARLRALQLARLARYERERAAILGRQAKLVLRMGAPKFARRIAWDAFRRWKAARETTVQALRALPVDAR